MSEQDKAPGVLWQVCEAIGLTIVFAVVIFIGYGAMLWQEYGDWIMR